MSYSYNAEKFFPGVRWTGGSPIHASIAKSGLLSTNFSRLATILNVLNENKFPESVWHFLMRDFSSMEWLLEEDSFKKLVLVDISRQLQGLGSSISEGSFKNPVTGNVFHRIALQGPMIGGIRFWAVPWVGDTVAIGFRFRIQDEKTPREQENVRETASRLKVIVDEEAKYLEGLLLEVTEPPSELESSSCVALVKQLEEY